MRRGSKYGTLTCRVDGCTTLAHCRELCRSHYRRWLNGDESLAPFAAPSAQASAPTPAAVRFWRFVTPTDGCWEWQGSTLKGYGRLRGDDGEVVLAHRLSYEMHVGPIPAGLSIDHLCRTPLCVNPAHLEPVTLAENNRRALPFRPPKARPTHCKHGHELTPQNTITDPNGSRRCRECSRRRSREWKRRQSASGARP